MTRKHIPSKISSDDMSELQTITVKIPAFGKLDTEELLNDLRFHNKLRQEDTPTELSWVKTKVHFDQEEIRHAYTPKLLGHIGPCQNPLPLSPEFYQRQAMTMVKSIEDMQVGIVSELRSDLTLDNLIASCIRLGRLLELSDLREKHLQQVTTRVKQQRGLAEHNEGREEINKQRMKDASRWHKIVEKFTSEQNDTFLNRKRSEQARIIQKELKRQDIRLAKGTIENFLRKSK